jgi:acyl-CoA synthetase (AMP-forming)/AMP-acid ligase II
MNTTDTLELQFACGRIGAVFLPLNTRLTVPELQYIAGDAAPGPNDDRLDIVMMDDFFYGEPTSLY